MSFTKNEYTKPKAKTLKSKKKVEEINELVIEEKHIKIGQITKDGDKIIHVYDDGRVLVSNKDCAKVINKSDI